LTSWFLHCHLSYQYTHVKERQKLHWQELHLKRFRTHTLLKWLCLAIALLLSACNTLTDKNAEFSFGRPYQVTINGLDQTIMIHTNSESNPVLLVLHGGPGYAMLPLMHQMNPQLEDEFTVVDWDQRGAGLSDEADDSTMTLEQFVDDAHESTLWLKQNYSKRKIYIVGHSFGTVLGCYLIRDYPDDYFAFVGVGQTVNVIVNEQYGYDWAYQEASNRSDEAALALLDAVGRPDNDGEYPGEVPGHYVDDFDAGSDVTIHCVSLYGGDVHGEENADAIDTLILDSGVYDEDSWIDAWQFSQTIFEDPAVWAFDFKNPSQGFLDFDVPVYFFMGQHDYDTPVNLFEEYYALIASDKSYVRFEYSAHFPFYEEAAKFREELLRVKTDTYQ
jgi:proline iminopeptidase